jgi:hypothetical protein
LAGKPHGERLEEWAEGATQIHVFVSFLFPEGVKSRQDAPQARARGPDRQHLLPRDTQSRRSWTCSPSSRRKKASPNKLRVKVAHGRDKDGFHGKFYRFVYADGTARVVVGSANLSGPGLEGLGELSLTVAGLGGHHPQLEP